MTTILRGVRPSDVVLTLLLSALAVAIGLENVHATANSDVAHAVESHSWALIPVFVLAVLPILVRRTRPLPALGASTAVLLASLPMFGWVTRCGFGLPLSIAFAYAIARFVHGRGAQLAGLAGVLAMQVVVCVMDSSTGGLGGLVVGVPGAALFYAAGLVVHHRSQRSVARPPSRAVVDA